MVEVIFILIIESNPLEKKIINYDQIGSFRIIFGVKE